jgi:ATP-dependent Clp protease ATP-binding subunit ClpC
MWLSYFLKKLKPTDEPIDVSRFTPRAQQMLLLARGEAIRLHQEFIETEHILLGLIKLGGGVAVNVLGNLGMDLQSVRAEVEKLIGSTPDGKMVDNPTYSPRAKCIFQLAKEEARKLNHTYTGTEHLLLGLLRVREGVAAEIFQRFCVDTMEVQKGILAELNPNFDGGKKGA